MVAAHASHLQLSFGTFSPKTHLRYPPADLREAHMCFVRRSDPTSRATRMAAWQANFERNVLGLSAAWSWVVMDRLGAPHWRQVGPRARAACVPPLSTHSIAHLRARLCWPLPLRACTSDVAGAEAKAVRDLELHAAAARAASEARRRRRGRLERGQLGASLGDRLSVGCLGRLFLVSEVPPGDRRRLWRLWRLCRRLWRRRHAHLKRVVRGPWVGGWGVQSGGV